MKEYASGWAREWVLEDVSERVRDWVNQRANERINEWARRSLRPNERTVCEVCSIDLLVIRWQVNLSHHYSFIQRLCKHVIKKRTVESWALSVVLSQISLAFYFLNDKLGASFLVGVGIIIIMVPINIRVSIAARQYQAQQLVLKDQRLKMINEMLSGIKVSSKTEDDQWNVQWYKGEFRN